ncbi:MAG: MMPL family transporter [Deltaproteobacteria bacterium]|nr:MMPL family transporter [Deltaproteobacteria bacterium]
MRFGWTRQSGRVGLCEAVLRNPAAALVIAGALTVFFLWRLPDLSFRTSIYDLIIEDIPEHHEYLNHKRVFGSDEIIRVVVRAGDVFDPVTFEAVARISDAAAGIEGVRRVISLPRIKKEMDLAGDRSVEAFEKVTEPVRLFRKNLISKDHSSTVLNLILDADTERDQVIAEVEQVLSKTPDSLTVYQIGMPLVSDALARYARQDFFGLPPVTMAAIAIILLLLYRNLHCLILPLLTVSLAVVWTLGLMAALGLSMSLVTMIVPVFLIAVGTAYCMHLCSSYMDEVSAGEEAGAAVRRTLDHIALPTVLAVVTTVVGIGSLWINRIPAVREFALLTCFGMLSLLVLLLGFFPAVLVLLPPPRRGSRGLPFVDRIVDRWLEWIVWINTVHPKKALVTIGILTAVFGAGIFFVRVETNPVSFFKEDTEISRRFHDIYRDMSGSFPAQVVLRGNADYFFESPRHMAAIQELQTFLGTLEGVDKSVSFADYLQLVNYMSNRYEPGTYRLPEEDFEARMLINDYKSLLGEDILRPFMNPEFSAANILLLTHLSSSRDFRDLQERIAGYAQESLPPGMSLNVTGLGVVISASSHLLTMGQIKSLSLSLGVVFLIMTALFLSGKVGLIAVLPNCFPIIVAFGLMGWLGIPLSLATSLIAGIVIGLAVDDTIHYLARYNREFRRDLNKDRALRSSVMSVGRPVTYTTLTISAGFSVLLFSRFQPTAVFGGLMVVTMLTALVADLVLLPSLMLRIQLVTAWDLLKVIPTLGSVPAGMAHELNQPLNAIKMGSEFLRIMVRRGAEVERGQLEEVAGEISRQVDRASTLLRRFSEFHRKPPAENGLLDVNEPIRISISVLENQLKLEDIELKLDLAEGLPGIEAAHDRLTQVMYNLLTNAREAVESVDDRSCERRIEVRSFQEEDRVKIRVADSGAGVPSHLRNRVFEAFFTTKDPGQGKGLGLSISREIVRECGGRLEVQPLNNRGTTFVASFPVPRLEDGERPGPCKDSQTPKEKT